MKQRSYSFAFAALLPLAALVAGCGDDGGSDNPAPSAGGSAQAGSGGTAGSGGSTAGSGGSTAGTGGSTAGSGGSTAGSGGSTAGSGGSDAGSGGSETAGSGGSAGGNGGSNPGGDGCSAPMDPPSKGACFKTDASNTCNPVTNEGCNTAAGEACDFGQNGFECYPDGNTEALCADCSSQGPFCQGGLTCAGGKCAKFCCDDGDCGGGFCDTSATGVGGLGVCGVKPCAANTDCTDSTKPICDTATGQCGECAADTDCKDPAKSTCASGVCVGVGNCCEATADVPGCSDSTIKDCVCAQDSYCCDTEWDETCIGEVAELGCGLCPGQCKADTDCKDAAKPLCDNNECIAKCASNADCSGTKDTCDTASGKCVECTANADCSGTKPLCDTKAGACVGCLANTDCKDAASPLCDTKVGTCKGCLADTDCKAPTPLCTTAGTCGECKAATDCKDPNKPVCNAGTCIGEGNCCESTPGVKGCTDNTIEQCVCAKDDFCCTDSWDATCVGEVAEFGCGLCPGQCKADTDCKDAAKPLCDASAFSCVECLFGTDCKDAAKPICNAGACEASTANACVGDDTYEQGDDGPNGAADLTPAVGASKEAKDHSICGQPAAEADYFKVSVEDGEGVTVTVDWTDAKQDVDVAIVDSKGTTYGLDFYAKPAIVKLSYLPKGTYYIAVNRFDGQAASTAVTPYTIKVERSAAAKCAGIADCAKEFQNQLFRGSCNATSGACESIDGQGKVAEGAACDSASDCASGACAAMPLTKDADKYAFCARTCEKDSDCSGGQVCTTVFQQNFCTNKCTSDQNCPVDVNTAPTSGPWTYLTCDTQAGTCAQLARPGTFPEKRRLPQADAFFLGKPDTLSR